MATVTNTTEVKLLAAFSDEDDRTITVPDPKTGITSSDIENLASLAANVLIGDKYGASFTRFKDARYVYKTVTDYGITPPNS